jgi:hypothetical protein
MNQLRITFVAVTIGFAGLAYPRHARADCSACEPYQICNHAGTTCVLPTYAGPCDGSDQCYTEVCNIDGVCEPITSPNRVLKNQLRRGERDRQRDRAMIYGDHARNRYEAGVHAVPGVA